MKALGALDEGIIYVADLTRFRIELITDRIVEVLGVQREAIEHLTFDPSVKDLDFRHFIHPDDLDLLLEHDRDLRAATDDDVVKVHCRLRHADRTWRWVEARSRVLSRDAAGRIRLAVGIAVPLPLRKTAGPDSDVAALLLAEESERRRIARELHDSAAQHLVAMDLQLSRLKEDVAKPRKASAVQGRIKEIGELIGTLQRELRTYAFAMHAPELDRVELVEVLRNLSSGFERRTGLKTTFELRGTPITLWRTADHALLRVAQEALMNIHKHARAKSAVLRLVFAPRSVLLEVEDDGIGGGGATIGGPKVGAGLENMRDRMAAIGGVLSILPRREGFLVRAWVGRPETVSHAATADSIDHAEAPAPRPRRPTGKSVSKPPTPALASAAPTRRRKSSKSKSS